MKLHQSILNGRRRENCAPANAGRTMVILLTAVLASFSSALAQTNYQRLLSFSISEFSAGYPNSPLIEGSDGAFYGTTEHGGNRAPSGSSDGGMVFRVREDGSGFTVLHSFSPTVFKLNEDGSGSAVLHRFAPTNPLATQNLRPALGVQLDVASLMQGTDGALYGMIVKSWLSDVRDLQTEYGRQRFLGAG